MGVLPGSIRPFGLSSHQWLETLDDHQHHDQNNDSTNSSDYNNVGFTDNAAFLIPIGIGLSTLSLLTFFGNAMVVHAIRTERKLHTVSNMFILSLAIADLIVGLLVMPLSSTYVIFGDWILGLFVCQLWLVIDYTASTASILNLLILSLDRYWSIRSPLKYLCKRTKKRALAMIGIVWMISALWAIPIIGWHLWYSDGVRKHPDNVCETEFSDSVAFKITTSIANFIVPMTLMVILYYKIYREIKRRGNFTDMNHHIGGRGFTSAVSMGKFSQKIKTKRSKRSNNLGTNENTKRDNTYKVNMMGHNHNSSLGKQQQEHSSSASLDRSKNNKDQCDHCGGNKSSTPTTMQRYEKNNSSKVSTKASTTSTTSSRNRNQIKTPNSVLRRLMKSFLMKNSSSSIQSSHASSSSSCCACGARNTATTIQLKRGKMKSRCSTSDNLNEFSVIECSSPSLLDNNDGPMLFQKQNLKQQEKNHKEKEKFELDDNNLVDEMKLNQNLVLVPENDTNPADGNQEEDWKVADDDDDDDDDITEISPTTSSRHLKLEQSSSNHEHRMWKGSKSIPSTPSSISLSSGPIKNCDGNLENLDSNKSITRGGKRLRESSIFSSLSSSSSSASKEASFRNQDDDFEENRPNHKQPATMMVQHVNNCDNHNDSINENNKSDNYVNGGNRNIAYFTQLTLMSLQQEQSTTTDPVLEQDPEVTRPNSFESESATTTLTSSTTTPTTTKRAIIIKDNEHQRSSSLSIKNFPFSSFVPFLPLPPLLDHNENGMDSKFPTTTKTNYRHYSDVNVKVEYIDLISVNDDAKATTSNTTTTTTTTTAAIVFRDSHEDRNDPGKKRSKSMNDFVVIKCRNHHHNRRPSLQQSKHQRQGSNKKNINSEFFPKNQSSNNSNKNKNNTEKSNADLHDSNGSDQQRQVPPWSMGSRAQSLDRDHDDIHACNGKISINSSTAAKFPKTQTKTINTTTVAVASMIPSTDHRQIMSMETDKKPCHQQQQKLARKDNNIQSNLIGRRNKLPGTSSFKSSSTSLPQTINTLEATPQPTVSNTDKSIVVVQIESSGRLSNQFSIESGGSNSVKNIEKMTDSNLNQTDDGRVHCCRKTTKNCDCCCSKTSNSSSSSSILKKCKNVSTKRMDLTTLDDSHSKVIISNKEQTNKVTTKKETKIETHPKLMRRPCSKTHRFYDSFRLKTFNFSLNRNDNGKITTCTTSSANFFDNGEHQQEQQRCQCTMSKKKIKTNTDRESSAAALQHRNELKRVESSRLRQEKKAARQLGVILGAFILCWMPYIITYVVTAYCTDCISLTVHQVTIWLGYLNSFLNPFLYALCNENFKHAFKKMLGRLQQPQHYSNNFDQTLAGEMNNLNQKRRTFRMTNKATITEGRMSSSTMVKNHRNRNVIASTAFFDDNCNSNTFGEQTTTVLGVEESVSSAQQRQQ